MKNARTAERTIGPFEYGEAVDLIQQFALALTNLKLHSRFIVQPSPRPVIEWERRGDRKQGRKIIHYQVVLIDRRPDEPSPEGLTVLDIKVAEHAGYVKPETAPYEAFGQHMTLGEWAKAVGTTRKNLKARIDTGMTMEEALTHIALKKST